MRPPAIVSRKVRETGAHTGAVNLVVLYEAAVRAVHKYAVSPDVVHIIATHHHVVPGSAAHYSAFVHPLNAVALYEHIVDDSGLVGAGNRPAGGLARCVHQDCGAAVIHIKAVASKLTPDFVNIIVLDHKVVEASTIAHPHDYSLTAYANLIGFIRDHLHPVHLPMRYVLHKDSGAFRGSKVDYRTAGAISIGRHCNWSPLFSRAFYGNLPVECIPFAE